MSEVITSTSNSQSMYTNTDLALKLNQERRRVCGILGEFPGTDCPVFAGNGCEYAMKDERMANKCILKHAAQKMMPLKTQEVQHEQI